MSLLTLPFGVLVGFSLGLTGGGGSIFAVPLLVYGLSTLPREAIGISLAAVGATAFIGFVQRLRTKEVELGTGLLFAVAGMLGAPVGSLLGGHISDTLLLGLFALLMLLVATRMWVQTLRNPEEASAVRALPASESERRGPACKRDSQGKLSMTSRCALALTLAGLLTGVLSGLFGVGGGFVIVPALVFFSQMDIHRAVATSLLVITLISASGVVSHVVTGASFDAGVAALFATGGVVGLMLGTLSGKKLSGPVLQRVFAVSILGVALFVITKSFM